MKENRLPRLLKRVDSAWEGFKVSYADLPEERLLEPGVVGDWSVKDILAHITIWDEEALKHLPLIASGGRPPRYVDTHGGIDAFNSIMIEKKRDQPLADALAQLDATHDRLIQYLTTVPDHLLGSGTRFRHRLRLDTYGHYPIHTKGIQEWRSRTDNSM